MFDDRREAARALAARLARYKGDPRAVVLAIPRGGVVVGAVLAEELDLPLDVVLTKKVGHPANPEFAIGAVSLTGESFDEDLVRSEGIPASYLRGQVERIRENLRKRSRLFRGDAPPAKIAGKTVILTDDGAATGRTALAAAELLRGAGAARIVIAVPVAPPEALAALERAADETVCLESPEDFLALGACYRDFAQVEDDEVLALMRGAPR